MCSERASVLLKGLMNNGENVADDDDSAII